MKTSLYIISLVLVIALDLPLAHAGVEMPAPTGTNYYSTPTETPTLHTSTSLRDVGTGLNISVFGGANVFQNGTLKINSTAIPGDELNGHTEDRTGGVGGLKFGMTWPSFSRLFNPQDSLTEETGNDLVMPSLQFECFWTGYNYKASASAAGSNGSLTTDLNTATLALDPEIKFNVGWFHPYIGFGVGGTYVNAGNMKVTNSSGTTTTFTGSDDDFDFSVQGIAGAEFFVDPHWALSFEYKYLYIIDPTFHGNYNNTPVTYKLDGLGNNLFTAGWATISSGPNLGHYRRGKNGIALAFSVKHGIDYVNPQQAADSRRKV